MTIRTTKPMPAIFRFSPSRFGLIALGSAFLLSSGAHAAPQQPGGTQAQTQSSDRQGDKQGDKEDDQAGPPSLRHKDDLGAAPGNAAPSPSKGPGRPSWGGAAESNQPVTPPPDNAPALTEQSKL